MIRVDAPPAEVLRLRSGDVTILCPYCGYEHTHQLFDRRAVRHRFAPACGIERTPDQRETGYVVLLTGNKTRQNRNR